MMKRFAISVLAGAGLIAAVSLAAAAPVPIQNSKHNLSSTGTGAIKSQPTASGGTTEICVFCHTPHSASTVAPLWNRSLPLGSYATYTSDIMAGIGYSIEDPLNAAAAGYAVHVKTRVCMSCHDGTIALGNLRNLPSGMSGDIPMSGTVGGKIGSTSPGYLGTDIRDDHPVAVKHRDPAALPGDPELIPATGNIRLYYNAGGSIRSNQADGNYIECTSCHDPHDNQFGNFLIDTNQFSRICTSCHNKDGYSAGGANQSVHSNTTYSTSYSPPSGALDAGNPQTLGASVQQVKCMDCHFTHKTGLSAYPPAAPNAGSGKYLLTYQEEATCFNNTNRWGQASIAACHGLNAPNLAGSPKNLQSETGGGIEGTASRAAAHRVGIYSQKHSAVEGRGGWNWAASGMMHVECDDCHNSHTAGRLLHTTGTNTVSSTSSIYGTGGVNIPTWPAGWNATFQDSTFTYIQPFGAVAAGGGVTYEWQICLKCHSTFANGAPYAAPPTYNWTDQAKEFNTSMGAGGSWHPVVGQNAARYGTTQFTAGSGFTNNSLMYCSDCHTNNAASPQPQGPHGAANAGILRAPANMNYGANGSTTKQSNADLCLICHDPAIYNTEATGATNLTGFRPSGATSMNLHNRHAFFSGPTSTSAVPNRRAYMCANCHTRVSHGWRRKGLVVFRGDGVGEPWSNAYEAGGASTGLIDSTSALPASAAYGYAKNANCSTASSTGCHQ